MGYLLKASAIVAIFYGCYYLFLQRDTFFESNRWFLLLGLITAFCVPFIVIPIYIEQISTPIQDFIFVENGTVNTVNKTFDTIQIISSLYIIGAIFFFLRFIIQLYSLSLLLIKNEKQKSKYYTFVETCNNVAPFSFFKWIVYNPNKFSESELKQILAHEKVHARQWHSIDIIISQLTSIILWFNPIIWLYRKNLQQNLEFIADQNAQHEIDCKKGYQHLLLKTSVPTHQLALTNNFYNSLIKRRIVMLHKKRSKNSNQWKFALILPLFILFLMSFNTKEITAYNDAYNDIPNSFEDAIVLNEQETNTDQEKLNSTKVKAASFSAKAETPKVKDNSSKTEAVLKNNGNYEMIIITKGNTDSDLGKIKTMFRKEGLTVKFKGIKRNDKGEITAIKIDLSSKGSNANYNTNSDDPINPIKISFDREGNNISIGNTSMIHHDGFVFETKDGKHKIHTSGKDTNIFVFSSDDDEEHEHDDDDDNDKIIIKHGNELKEWVIDEDVRVKIDGKAIKVKSIEKAVKVQSIGKGKGNKVFFSNSGGQGPLFVLDGKIVAKDKIGNLDSDTIEKIEVLKGDSATEKYGEKGENGAILITAKKKE